MYSHETWQKIEQELSAAQAARDQGLEGRARVCARRAAGVAIRDFLHRQGRPAEGSAYDLLLALQALPDVAENAQRAAAMLSERVTPDHHLPSEGDLLKEARKLIDLLAPRPGSGVETHLTD